MRALPIALTLAGCAASHGARYPFSTPASLPDASQPLEPDDVALSFDSFTWQATAGTETSFRVMLSALGGAAPRIDGEVLGDLRTADRAFDAADRAALWCAWGPGQNEEYGCSTPNDVQARAHVVAVLDDLRAEAARVGATEVRDVRCFVRARRDGGRLWCEGLGATGQLDAAAMPTTPPAVVIVAKPAPGHSPWRLGATFTAGRFGDRLVVGTTLDLAYRGVKTAFHMVSPADQRSAALGFDLLIRHALDDRFAVLGGVSAMLLAQLAPGGMADNEKTRGGLGPVLGLGVESLTFSLFDGFGKPFAELRAGWLFAPPEDGPGGDLAGPNLELLLGLVTP